MSKFSFGDKVRLTSNSFERGYRLKAGTIGIVMAVTEDNGNYTLGCHWQNFNGGHTLGGILADSGLWVLENEVETANLPVVVADAEAPRKAVKKRVYGVKKDGSLNPQSKLVLKLMTDKGSVTSVEASAVYRVRALPRRIADLKAAGHKISRVLSKDATGQRYARYYLAA